MADTKISALTDGTTAEATDRIPVARDPTGTPLSRFITPAYISEYIRTLTQTLSNKTFSDRVTITQASANAGIIASTGYSLTGSNITSMVDLAGTWNTSGTPTAIKLNITDTASTAASLLLDFQVGGSKKLSVRKDGLLIGDATGAATLSLTDGAGAILAYSNWNVAITGTSVLFRQSSTAGASINTATGAIALGPSGTQAILTPEENHALALRNSTSAQTFRNYGTFTDASNYRRLAISMTTAGVASIAPEGAGSGASGNVLHISGLPTSNPGPGILWNNAGTPAIGT